MAVKARGARTKPFAAEERSSGIVHQGSLICSSCGAETHLTIDEGATAQLDCHACGHSLEVAA